ncbi:unnamed protein product [Cyclocybe aegerita]|uniref:Hydrophobin n=1 Tax=Cyclocybe aegerita TaxID=1973307 RepID=A0A8S0W410_CYCAE|nr:unnamed protein product [Cyclocybe aegerita]
MFSKAVFIITAAFATFAVAGSTGVIHKSCTTGPVQCCNVLAASTSSAGRDIIAGVNVDIHRVTGLVGAQCSPVAIIGAGSARRRQCAAKGTSQINSSVSIAALSTCSSELEMK